MKKNLSVYLFGFLALSTGSIEKGHATFGENFTKGLFACCKGGLKEVVGASNTEVQRATIGNTTTSVNSGNQTMASNLTPITNVHFTMVGGLMDTAHGLIRMSPVPISLGYPQPSPISETDFNPARMSSFFKTAPTNGTGHALVQTILDTAWSSYDQFVSHTKIAIYTEYQVKLQENDINTIIDYYSALQSSSFDNNDAAISRIIAEKIYKSAEVIESVIRRYNVFDKKHYNTQLINRSTHLLEDKIGHRRIYSSPIDDDRFGTNSAGSSESRRARGRSTMSVDNMQNYTRDAMISEHSNIIRRAELDTNDYAPS